MKTSKKIKRITSLMLTVLLLFISICSYPGSVSGAESEETSTKTTTESSTEVSTEATEETKKEDEQEQTKTLTCALDQLMITVSDPNEVLPAGAKIEIKEVDPNKETEEKNREEATKKRQEMGEKLENALADEQQSLGEWKYYELSLSSFLGIGITPKEPLNVTIEYFSGIQLDSMNETGHQLRVARINEHGQVSFLENATIYVDSLKKIKKITFDTSTFSEVFLIDTLETADLDEGEDGSSQEKDTSSQNEGETAGSDSSGTTQEKTVQRKTTYSLKSRSATGLKPETLPESGSISMTSLFQASWDDSAKQINALSVTVKSTNTDNVYFRLKYSDDGGTTWVDGSDWSGKTGKGEETVVAAKSDALTNVPLHRLYRIYATKNTRDDISKQSCTATVSLYDILDSVKSGFYDWLINSYVQDFGGNSLPITQEALYAAFSIYYNLPVVTISERTEGDTMYVDAETDSPENMTYHWEYQNNSGEWITLGDHDSKTLNATNIALLNDGGKNIRCKLYEGDKLKSVSNVLFVNPKRKIYDQAIEAINSGLSLGSLQINGTAFTNYFYYENVKRDSRVPFEDAASYADYLAKTYLDNGGGQAGLDAVKEEWDKYLYDLYDPTSKSNISSYPKYTYGDNDLEWPKDSTSSFHGTSAMASDVKVDDLSYDYLENGVDYANFINSLDKSVTADAAGDGNTERKYKVDLTADAQAKADGPVALILQIQTSWQMFDMEHSNALKGNGYTQVGSVSNNTSLANLYDIKQALLRLVEYMNENHPGSNLVLGVTEVQHAGSQTMLLGTDQNGKALYVSNNYDVLKKGLLNWDSFGNCEHVHYDTKTLENVCKNLSSNLSGWKDMLGYNISYQDIQKVVVVIGGPTENTNSTNGYGCTLPWSTFQSAGLNSVYSIRTNEGTSNGSGLISWLDNSANNSGSKFKDGKGTTFTQKYVATDEDAVFNALVQIAEKEMKAKGIGIDAESKYVEDVKIEDTISEEFILDKDETIQAIVYDKDGKVESTTEISWSDANLNIIDNEDGTTTISYTFDKMYNTKKYKLHFGIVAKEDYIGSNNVFSNVGTPELEYSHTKLDQDGNPTGVVETYTVQCEDTPQVNVPIRFTTVDGGSHTIDLRNPESGTSVDLADLSESIVENAEDLVDNYGQINGTLSYVWELSDGTTVDAGSVKVTNGSIGEFSFPDRSYIFDGEKEGPGEYQMSLKVSFIPEAVDGKNENFSDTKTATAVNTLEKPGDVKVTVIGKNGQTFTGPVTMVKVTKTWADGADKHSGDSVTVTLYKKIGDKEVSTGKKVELNAANNWTANFTDIPYYEADQTTQVSYFVKETQGVDGYRGKTSAVESHSVTAWVHDTGTLVDGQEYVFTSSKTKNNVTTTGAIGIGTDGKIIVLNTKDDADVLEVGGEVSLGLENYDSSLSKVADEIKWTVHVNQNGEVSFFNEKYQKYLAITNKTIALSSTPVVANNTTNLNSTTWFQVQNNKISATYFTRQGKPDTETKYIKLNDNLDGIGLDKENNATSLDIYHYMLDYSPFPEDYQTKYQDNIGEKYYSQSIKNMKWDPINGNEDTFAFDSKPTKTIDYLGDTDKNHDTDAYGDDLYRLYLDFTGYTKPMDLLIVVDSTTSMTAAYGSNTRIQTLDELVNGTIKGSKPASGDYTESLYSGAERAADGFIYSFLSQNPENKVGVIKLAGGNGDIGKSYEDNKDNVSEVIKEWTTAESLDLSSPKNCYTDVITMKSGTDYDASYYRMDEMLQQVAGDGNQKLVLFISDGEPNIYINDDGNFVKENTFATCYEKTKAVWDEFKEMYPSLLLYTVGIFDNNESAERLLKDMSGANRFYKASDANALRTTFQDILKSLQVHSFEVSDQLSKYVDWYSDCPDLKIVRTDKDGTETVIWKSMGSATQGTIGEPVNNTITQNGTEISVVESVIFTPSSDDASHGTLKVTFNPDLQVDQDTKYTISYNIKVSEDAFAECVNNVYAGKDMYNGSTGDPQTDYGSNRTSSQLPGFHANYVATLSCQYQGVTKTCEYDHPVVQVLDDYELPSTGGRGTYLFTLVGITLLMTAVFLQLRKKRENV